MPEHSLRSTIIEVLTELGLILPDSETVFKYLPHLDTRVPIVVDDHTSNGKVNPS